MEYYVRTSASVQCNRCGHINHIPADSFYETFHDVIGYGDMGPTIQIDLESDMDCENCPQEFQITATFTEYPADTHESGPSFQTRGCELISTPIIEYEDEIDFYEPDDEGVDAVDNVVDELEQFVNNPELLRSISPREFEEAVCEILIRKGFEATLTPQTRDGGKDIIAKYSHGGIPFVIYVECKQYGPKHKIGISLVQRMQAVQSDAHANKSVFVTTSSFSRDARKYADEHEITLVDWNGLKGWLSDAVNG